MTPDLYRQVILSEIADMISIHNGKKRETVHTWLRNIVGKGYLQGYKSYDALQNSVRLYTIMDAYRAFVMLTCFEANLPIIELTNLNVFLNEKPYLLKSDSGTNLELLIEKSLDGHEQIITIDLVRCAETGIVRRIFGLEDEEPVYDRSMDDLFNVQGEIRLGSFTIPIGYLIRTTFNRVDRDYWLNRKKAWDEDKAKSEAVGKEIRKDLADRKTMKQRKSP